MLRKLNKHFSYEYRYYGGNRAYWTITSLAVIETKKNHKSFSNRETDAGIRIEEVYL
jgi:hypothetical protein